MEAGSFELKVEGVHTDKKVEDMTLSELWSYFDYTGNQDAAKLLINKTMEQQSKPVIPDWDRNINKRINNRAVA